MTDVVQKTEESGKSGKRKEPVHFLNTGTINLDTIGGMSMDLLQRK